MKLTEFLLGGRRFFDKKSILNEVLACPYYDHTIENIDDADLLLIFKTSSQQSWLVFTNQRMYFVLDDQTESSPVVKWRRNKDSLVENKRISINLKLDDKSDKTGRVNIGNMNKGFLYTKDLFVNSSIKNSIYSLTEKHMISN